MYVLNRTHGCKWPSLVLLKPKKTNPCLSHRIHEWASVLAQLQQVVKLCVQESASLFSSGMAWFSGTFQTLSAPTWISGHALHLDTMPVLCTMPVICQSACFSPTSPPGLHSTSFGGPLGDSRTCISCCFGLLFCLLIDYLCFKFFHLQVSL